MAVFSRLICFESDGKIYVYDIGVDTIEQPPSGTRIKGYPSLDELSAPMKMVP
jgi:hypothetical protein